MTAVFTSQYRPHATSEADELDAVSVGFVRDLADSVNNTKRYALAHKLISELAVPIDKWVSQDNTVDEKVIHVFAPRFLPDDFLHLHCAFGGYRVQGSHDTAWKLYCGTRLYTADDTLDAASLGQVYYSSGALTIDSDTNEFVYDDTCKVSRDKAGLVWLVLTATNSNTDTRTALTSIDVWPIP